MGDPSGPIEENGGHSAADMDGPSSLIGVGPPSPLTGCYLLIILGEPHSPEHKDIILQKLLKGLLSWNINENHVDLEEELNTITSHAPEGEIARHGERLIQYASENLVTEILIHPQYNTLIQCMRNLLSSFTRHRHIIHAGYTFSGNGSWILQDGTFSVADFSEAFQENEVQRVLRAYPDTVSMDIHCDGSSGLWNNLPDRNYTKSCKIRINPIDILSAGCDKLNAFTDYLAPMLIPAGLTDLLESSDVVGNIRFSHPTLYVFPGGQGDAALFGINGFNMLVDGGFNRKACFWDFARHLDRLDAVLMTRINNTNIQGLSSVIERKYQSHVYPQIGHFFCNIPERKAESPALEHDKDSLMVDLIDKGHRMVTNLRAINLKPQNCYRDIEPMNLYHKVGHGTLDMYVISPSKESKEVRDFMQKWMTNDQKLFAAKETKEFQFPLQNLTSICALLVWQPANPDDTITRILFPGSTPDYKIIEGLEKIKHLEFMKHPICTAKKLVQTVSTSSLAKKSIKSATPEKTIPEPVVPSKVAKSLAHEPTIDNKLKHIQADNKAKESKLIEEQNETEKKPPSKVQSRKITSKKSESIEDKLSEEKVIAEVQEKKDIEESSDKSEKKDGEDTNEAEEMKKDEVDTKPKIKKTEPKSKNESTKAPIRSRIDSKPPKSMDRKGLKKDTGEKKEVGKSSPTTTPKKEPKLTNGYARDREIKSKVMSRTMRSSPSSTPAKSAKEANNRKVLESKTKAVKKEVVRVATVEKKEIKAIERKPISHRAKGISPSRRAHGSPIKSTKPKTEKDNIIRKAKLDKGGTTDSSLVSTPSADEPIIAKKIAEISVVDIESAKQRELDDLKEEQEAVREIEAVFKREEKLKKKDVLTEHREIVSKQDSATEAEDDEEYLIIEKEEVEQYTEDSINEPESSLTKEEEMQKHQRDSQESEKKRKTSLEATEEEVEPKEEEKEEKPEVEADKKEEMVETVEKVETNETEEDADLQPDSIEEMAEKVIQLEKEVIKEEVQDIITSAKEIVKAKTDSREEAAKTEETLSQTPEDKLSSAKKTTDTKDEVEIVPETKDGEVQNLPESQPFSATVESGATTAPTLPEDERIPLDQIKEDLVVEEKYVKEKTKETEVPISTAPPKVYEPLERIVPTKMHFDTTHPHLRDIVKTPDEVADLPVHEEADIETYEASEDAQEKGKDDEPAKKSVETESKPAADDRKFETEPEETDTKPPCDKIDDKKRDVSSDIIDDKVDDKEKAEVEKKEDEVEKEEKEKDEEEALPKSPPLIEKQQKSVADVPHKLDITEVKGKKEEPAETVEYVVEDLGQNFENTLKDVTPKETKRIDDGIEKVDSQKEIGDSSHVAKSKSPSPVPALTKSKSPSPVLQREAAKAQKSKTPSPIPQEETIEKSPSPSLDKKEQINEKAKTPSPTPSLDNEKEENENEDKPKSPSPTLEKQEDEAVEKSVSPIKIEKSKSPSPIPSKDEEKIVEDAKPSSPTPKDEEKTEVPKSPSPTQQVKVEQKITEKSKTPSPAPSPSLLLTEGKDKVDIDDDEEKDNLIQEDTIVAIKAAPVESKITDFIADVGKKIEDSITDSVKKVETTLDEVTKGIDSVLKDVIPNVEIEIPEKSEVKIELNDKLVQDAMDEIESKISSEDVDNEPKIVDELSKEVKEVTDKIANETTEVKEKVDEKIQKTTEKIDSVVSDVASGITSFIGKVTKDITTGIEDVTNKLADIKPKEEDEKEESDSEPMSKQEFKEVFDYSHPYGIKNFPTELRETHITTLDSPVAEKEKILDLKIMEKLPEHGEDDFDELSGKSTASKFNQDEYVYSFEREDSSLNDIKEEEEEDRITPPEKPISELRKISVEIADLTSKTLTTLDSTDRPRSVSPREEEVLKIVANVAEVLKSEKDITEIIPDFNEEELERKLQRVSPRLDDESSTVQRMLVTASSEDGGEETEICAEGSIKFSPAAVTPEVQSGRISPETTDKLDETADEIVDTKKESGEKLLSTPSSPDAKTSSISFDEKDKHEIPEKAQKPPQQSEAEISESTDSPKKTPELIEKIESITVQSNIEPVSVVDTRKESIMSDLSDGLFDSRRESAISTLSEKDYTKDETLTEEVIAAVTVTPKNLPTSEELVKPSPTKSEPKSPLPKDSSDDISRRESASSHVSDQSAKESSRPDSIISHFSDKTEPELKEKLGSTEKSPESDLDMSRPESISEAKDVSYKTDADDLKTVAERDIIRPESVTSHQSDKEVDKKEESRPTSKQSIASEDPTEGKSVAVSAKEEPKIVDEISKEIKEAVDEIVHETSEIKEKIDDKIQKTTEQIDSVVSGVTSGITSFIGKVAKDITTGIEDVTTKLTDSKSKEESMNKKEAIEEIAQVKSRPESVASHLSEKDEPDSKPMSRPESTEITLTQEQKDSDLRPISVTSLTSETDEVKEPSPIPEDSKSPDPTKPIISQPSEKEIPKDELSRPESVSSHISEKEDSKPIKDASRPESVVSHSSEKDVAKEVLPADIEKRSESPEKEIPKEEKSRPESVASQVSEKSALKEASRPESASSHVSEKEISKPGEGLSRPESVIDQVPEKEISEKTSRPASINSHISEPQSKEQSRPDSVASHISDKDVSKDAEKTSRPESVDSHVPDIEISKDTAQEVARPPSAISKASDKDTAKDEPLRPDSVASHISDTKPTETVSRSGSIVSHDSEKEHKPADATSRPASVASKNSEKEEISKDVISAEPSRPESATSHISGKEQKEQSRPESVASHISEKETPKDSKTAEPTSRPESVLSQTVEKTESKEIISQVLEKTSRSESIASHISEKDITKEAKSVEQSRPESVASHVSEKDITKDTKSAEQSRPESVASHVSEKDITKDTKSAEQSRPESVASHVSEKDITKDTKSAEQSRPESVASHVSEKEIIKETKSAEQSRPESVASHVSEKETPKESETVKETEILKESKSTEPSRPESVVSHVSEKEEPKDTKSTEHSRPESTISHISEKETSKDSKPDEEKSRPESVASHISEKSLTKETPSVEIDKASRPVSVASHISDKEMPKESKSTEQSRPESVASHISEKDTTKDSKPIETVSRSESVTSHQSEKETTKTSPEQSRPVSVASHISEKDLKIVEVTVSHQTEKSDILATEDLSKEVSKDVTPVDVKSRPESVTSHISDSKPIETASRSGSIISHDSDKEQKPIDSASRPESAASKISEKEEKSLKDSESIQPSRPESVTSHVSDKEKSSKSTDDKSRPESVASHISEKVDLKDPKSVGSSRPQSVASHVSEKETIKDVKVDEEAPRPESVISHTSEKDAPKETKSEEPSRPESVVSHTSDKELAKDSKFEEVKSGQPSRPESAVSHISDKDSPKDSKPDVVKSTETSRPESVASHVSEKDSKPDLTKSTGPSRPESVASHVSDKEIKVAETDSANEQIKETISVLQKEEEILVTQEEKLEIELKSRSESRASAVSDKEITDEKHIESTTEITEIDSVTRPESVASHVSEKYIADDTAIMKESRPESVASRVSDKDAVEKDTLTQDILKSQSRPESASSHVSEKYITDDKGRESLVSEKEILMVKKDSITPPISRPESAASHVSDIYLTEEKPMDLESSLAKDAAEVSTILPKEIKDEHKSPSPVDIRKEDVVTENTLSSVGSEQNEKSPSPSADIAVINHISESSTENIAEESRKESVTISGKEIIEESIKSEKCERSESIISYTSDKEDSEKTKTESEKPASPVESVSSQTSEKHQSSVREVTEKVTKESIISEEKHQSRPESVASHISDKETLNHTLQESISEQINETTEATTEVISRRESSSSTSSKIKSRRESAVDRPPSSLSDKGDEDQMSGRENRSKSVSSIMITSIYKPEGLDHMESFSEGFEESKHESVKTESIKESISKTSKIETKIEEKTVFETDLQGTSSMSPENDLSDKLSTETNISGKSSPTAGLKVSCDQSKISVDGLSGRSTPDIADVDSKSKAHISKSPNAPSSPTVKTEFSHIEAIAPGIHTPKDHSGKSSPFTHTTSESKSIPTSLGHGSTMDTPESSPKPTSPFPKGIEELRTSSGMTTPDMTRTSTPDCDISTTQTTTTISREEMSESGKITTSVEKTTLKCDTKTSERPLSKSDVSSSESHSQQTTRESYPVAKEVSAIKSESRSYTPGGEEFDVSSPRSDISSGQPSRLVTESDGHPGSDDEVAASPFSGTSQAPHSPSGKFSYDSTEYELQRSSSGVSKKSDLDIDDSQNDIPPEYGSDEAKSAISVSSSYKNDPMSTSVYGTLPESFGKSEPIPISGNRTIIKTSHTEFTSSGPEPTSFMTSKTVDHKFLDEADLDFEKALEEHRQCVGSQVMSSVTSKYEFSPSKSSLKEESGIGFNLSEVTKVKTESTKIETTSTSSGAAATHSQKVDDEKQAEIEARVSSWGKPMGLPSPAIYSGDNQTTPKKERRMMMTKTKLNNEKNLRKRSESPAKGRKSSPIYMDLTYVPHNGNSYYAHVEFFKRVRARYYVFSGTEPSRDVYNALLEAKQTWEDKDLEVTIIPTYDTDVLGYWVSENEDLLAKYHIDLSPSASRCTINLQDHETSCSAYRLEF